MKRLGGILVFGLMLVFLLGMEMPRSPGRVIEAQEIIVRDGNGTARARLAFAENAIGTEAGLALYDKDGKPRVILSGGTETTAPYLRIQNTGSLAKGGGVLAPSSLVFDNGVGGSAIRALIMYHRQSRWYERCEPLKAVGKPTAT
jgi:hypothetical protein